MTHIDPHVDFLKQEKKTEKTNAAYSRAIQAMELEYIMLVKRGDANKLCDFAPTVTDWDKVSASDVWPRETKYPSRMQMFWEVLEDSFSQESGPYKSELMQLLLNVANGADGVQSQAKELISRMAAHYADMHVSIHD